MMRGQAGTTAPRIRITAATRAQVSLDVIPVLEVIDYSLMSFEDAAESLISSAADLAL